MPAYWEPVMSPLTWRFMRIIICAFLIVTLAMSFGIWKLTSETHALTSYIRDAQNTIWALKKESRDIAKYKDAQGLSLDKFYPEVFNDIKEISFYYRVPSEIKIIEAKDLVNLLEFFKPSQYRGIRCVDMLCQIGLKDPLDIYSFEALYKIMKNRPLEILGVEIENGVLNLTMRLYGP